MKLERNLDKEATQPLGTADQHWRAICPLAIIHVYQRRGEWLWRIVTVRPLPFISLNSFASKEAAWAEAKAKLAALAQYVLADAHAAEEAAHNAR